MAGYDEYERESFGTGIVMGAVIAGALVCSAYAVFVLHAASYLCVGAAVLVILGALFLGGNKIEEITRRSSDHYSQDYTPRVGR